MVSACEHRGIESIPTFAVEISMGSSALCGHSILLVEAEPVAAHHAEVGLREAGAKVFGAHQLRDALFMAEYPALSAAVVAQRLGSEQTTTVCKRLAYLGVPFMIYTRFDATDARQRWPTVPVMAKPASTNDLITAVVGLLH
jgi:DNA-binding response OmpR family regulator